MLSGKLLTGRDAAHKRICALLDAGQPLPDGLDFTGRVIYYVGPVDPVGTEVVGPAGPTTANRMDRFTDTMLGKSGLLAMVGKAERGPETVASIAKHRSAYLIAVGGAAFLVSNAIRGSRVVAFPELGMEAVYEFDVKDMPVTVAVSAAQARSGARNWTRSNGPANSPAFPSRWSDSCQSGPGYSGNRISTPGPNRVSNLPMMLKPQAR